MFDVGGSGTFSLGTSGIGSAGNDSDDDSLLMEMNELEDQFKKEFKEVNEEITKKCKGGEVNEEYIMKKCDEAHNATQQTLSRSFLNVHEIGGDGDVAMGSERNHFKRKHNSDDADDPSDVSPTPSSRFRPRDLFNSFSLGRN